MSKIIEIDQSPMLTFCKSVTEKRMNERHVSRVTRRFNFPTAHHFFPRGSMPCISYTIFFEIFKIVISMMIFSIFVDYAIFSSESKNLFVENQFLA